MTEQRAAETVQLMYWECLRAEGTWEEFSGDQLLELAYELHDYICGDHPTQQETTT